MWFDAERESGYRTTGARAPRAYELRDTRDRIPVNLKDSRQTLRRLTSLHLPSR